MTARRRITAEPFALINPSLNETRIAVYPLDTDSQVASNYAIITYKS